jgi:hypothetical protein
MKDLKDAIEKGTKAWADVPDATEWVEELRGNETEKQEPVAWMTINEYGEEDDIHYENPEGHLLEGWTYKPLYTHPPSVQPKPEPLEYWNAVEGWVKIDEVREHFNSVGCGTIYKTAGEDRVPLYTTPPAAQRTWVGLTDGEMVDLLKEYEGRLWVDVCRAIEAKLKEKNIG